jgi:hypothetical protein
MESGAEGCAWADECFSRPAYFHGVRSALASQGGHYVPGVYGSRNVCGRVTGEAYVRWAFVSGMSWGFSGSLGFPLPKAWAFNQIKEFRFENGSDLFDLDRVVHREGADFGVDSVNDRGTPTDGFSSYIENLYGLAKAYGKGDPNLLVMDFVRHEKYDDTTWRTLLGAADQGFIDHVRSKKVELRRSFIDRFTGTELGAEHLFATMCGHYKIAQPGGNLTNRGDVAGWGGDLMTFYGEWHRDSDKYPDGRAYCETRLAKPDVLTSFGYSDLIEDADGYLIAKAVKDGKNIVDAFRARGRRQPDPVQALLQRAFPRLEQGRRRRRVQHAGPAGRQRDHRGHDLPDQLHGRLPDRRPRSARLQQAGGLPAGLRGPAPGARRCRGRQVRRLHHAPRRPQYGRQVISFETLFVVANTAVLPAGFLLGAKLVHLLATRRVWLSAQGARPGVELTVLPVCVAVAAYVPGLWIGFDTRGATAPCVRAIGNPMQDEGPAGELTVVESQFPLSRECRWGDGTRFDLVPLWLNVVIFAALAGMVIGCVLAVAGLVRGWTDIPTNTPPGARS